MSQAHSVGGGLPDSSDSQLGWRTLQGTTQWTGMLHPAFLPLFHLVSEAYHSLSSFPPHFSHRFSEEKLPLWGCTKATPREGSVIFKKDVGRQSHRLAPSGVLRPQASCSPRMHPHAGLTPSCCDVPPDALMKAEGWASAPGRLGPKGS